MYIKRLEMHGFKSFADKTVIDLTPGITVIVGPNGCGKSNIVDALRWVLGEQSARDLRGLRMDDVIFNGTANRKPLGFAEVMVVLDNTEGLLDLDYQEISIGRRIYRNGETEYLLNKNICRLKDIIELFMDTGMGKDAYSIVGQGKVDEIINARPVERRLIFEETAGILKYKTRKQKALKRLAETTDNLLRIGDIISELSSQLEPLAKQAKLAEKYHAYRRELKKKEVDLIVCDARELRDKWYETDGRIKKVADELLSLQTELNKQEEKVARCQLLFDETQSEVAESQQKIRHLSAELERMQGKIALDEEKLKNIDRHLQQYRVDIAEIEEQKSQLEKKKSELEEEIALQQERMEQAEMELEQARLKLQEMASLPEAQQAEDVQKRLENIAIGIRRLQSEHDRLNLEKEKLHEKINQFNQQREAKRRERKELLSKLEAISKQIRDYKRQQTDIQLVLEEREKEAGKILAETEKITAQLGEQEEITREVQNRLNVLNELEANMAGYYPGVKTVLTAKNEKLLSGIYGTVADIITVPDRYVKAVEMSLGTNLQNIVTADEKSAKAAIAYLKKVKGGRATFLPLDILQVQPRHRPKAETAKMKGYLGVAADVVKTGNKFRPVVEFLLSGIHLFTDLDAALAAARSLNYRERLVTLAGEVIRPGGAITGGAEKKAGGVLSRRREAELLEDILQKNKLALAEIQEEKEFLLKRQGILSEEIKTAKEKKRQLELEEALAKQEKEGLEKQLAALDEALQLLEGENNKELENLTGLEKLCAAAENKLASALKEEKELRIEAARLSGILSARSQEINSLQEHHTGCRIRIASLQQKRQHLQEELEENYRQIKMLLEKKKKLEENINEQLEGYRELERLMAEDIKKLRSIQAEYEESAGLLAKRENRLKELNTGFREESELLRQTEKRLHQAERKKSRWEMERERLETEMKYLLDQLRNTWELDFASAEQIAGAISDKDAVREEIRQIKDAIQTLGTVNLGAIEEYRRVKERLEFLQTQQQDLRQGQKDLEQIIREIDKRMGEKFVSAFNQINKSFNKVFQELFGGGNARLNLTDPENPLESGVEIIARPPGKKLQQLSLLSGGEKALTAIGLIFAFLRVKPVPFCVFDEIEATLDEANLTRFSNYLQRFAGQTQFILVSHRKKTMEQADILYGVTMEEAGVSKLISVRLRDNKTA